MIIAVDNIPPLMKLSSLVATLASTIKGHFEALNFVGNKDTKTAYLRLGPKVDPEHAISNINKKLIKKKQLKAYVPDVVPNFKVAAKPRTIPPKMRRKLKIAPNVSKEMIINKAMECIMLEMQTKFTGLYKLSADNGHHLLDGIGKIVHDRLTETIETHDYVDSCYKLTSQYRRGHPHTLDFQLIISTLHELEAQAGKPRSEIQESQLTAVPLDEFSAQSYDVMLGICDSNITRISKMLVKHVQGLSVRGQTTLPDEEAQMKVRRHLKQLKIHIPDMVKQVIHDHCLPEDKGFSIVKVYGEPYLPSKEMMAPFMKQFHAASAIRSDLMYNCISFKVPNRTHLQMLQADGAAVKNAKLVIRPAPKHRYAVPLSVTSGGAGPRAADSAEEPDPLDMDWSESW